MASTDERKPHLLVQGTAESQGYTYPKEVRGPTLKLRPQDRAQHGNKLRHDLAQVRAALPELARRREAAGLATDGGVYLEFESEAGFELAVQSLDRKPQRIELMTVRMDNERTIATVFVPVGKLQTFEKIVEDYATQLTRFGKPKNAQLVDSIGAIRRAVLRSFWTESESFPEDHDALWWEVWLRSDGTTETLERFRLHATKHGMRVGESALEFPDRMVCLAYGTPAQMSSSAELLDVVAELRRAKELASVFTNMPASEQEEWAQSLLDGLSPPRPDAPAVCVLDSGVTRAHPLIEPALAREDMHTYDEAWGTADSLRWRGHGTSMAGLALYGDLTDVLLDTSPHQLEHRLESVKVLPPRGYNEPRLYGAITQDATARPEIAVPTRRRVFSLAVTAGTADRGAPSSWSAEIDRLAFGDEDEGQRLFVIAAGNVRNPADWKTCPESNDLEQVLDPGQSWNALTVGAYTEKCVPDPKRFPDWTPVALPGTLSPTSRTTVLWRNTAWPPKPDVVLEGGNAAMNPATEEAEPIDDLRLVSTHWRPRERLFEPIGDTSAATAQAARLAAVLMARYPQFWPETVRALLVHSAEWTPGMREQVTSEKPGRQHDLLRRRYGWGAPSVERASWSASNVLTLVAQEVLRPYGDPVRSKVPTHEMHFHALPWPEEALEELGNTGVKLRVTLSYFIDPSPGKRGHTNRYRYASHGLRFEVPRAGELPDDFKARMNKEAQDELEGSVDYKESEWNLRQPRGSLHSDWLEVPAVELLQRGYVVVRPIGGWWKERRHLEGWRKSVRYSLVVSIQAPEVGVDIYTPVASAIEAEVQV